MSLMTFLQSGELHGLRVGMTREQVIQTLGQPEAVGGTSRKYHQPVIFKYGDLEAHFNHSLPDVCERIYIENSIGGMPILLPACCDLEDWRPLLQSDRGEVERYLQANEMEFEEISQFAGLPPAIVLRCSGVHITFDENDVLWSISVEPS